MASGLFLDKLSKFVTSVYGPIFIYLTIYLFGWVANVQVFYIRNLFLILHVLVILLSAGRLLFALKTLGRSDLLFWFGLLLVFAIPGPTLEFPSDPWAHLARIYSWDMTALIGLNEIRHKFAYFLNWTFVYWAPIEMRRWALNIPNVFWQMLLAVQIYRFCDEFEPDPTWKKIQTCAYFAIFGTNLFSVRYYALSSTMLSFICYFEFLKIIFRIYYRRSQLDLSLATKLFVLLFIIYFNHIQEVGLAALAIIALFFERFFYKASVKAKATIALLWALLLLLGYCWVRVHPSALLTMPYHHLSKFAVLRLWDPELPFFKTLGVHGIIGLIFSVFFFKKFRALSILTLLPVILAMIPPFIVVMSKSLASDSPFYRLFYIFPTSFLMILGLKSGLSKVFKKRLMGAILGTIVVIFSLTLNPTAPWYGRLLFQLSPTTDTQGFNSTDQTADWLETEIYQKRPNCQVILDDYTSHLTHSLLGRPTAGQRLKPLVMQSEFNSYHDILLRTKEVTNFCGFLIADPKLISPVTGSFFGKTSGHWSEWIDLRWVTLNAFKNTASVLRANGWQEKYVPPYYTYFENASEQSSQKLSWSILDLSQNGISAYANLAKFPDGGVVLVNAGPRESNIAEQLLKRGVYTIDQLAVSQTDDAHAGGVLKILDSGVRVKSILYQDVEKDLCLKGDSKRCSAKIFDEFDLRVRLEIPSLQNHFSPEEDLYKNGAAGFIKLKRIGSKSLKNWGPLNSSINWSLTHDKVSLELMRGELMGGYFDGSNFRMGDKLHYGTAGSCFYSIFWIPNNDAAWIASGTVTPSAASAVALISTSREAWFSQRCYKVKEYFHRKNVATFVSGIEKNLEVTFDQKNFSISVK